MHDMKDISHLIFMYLESKELGAIIRVNQTQNKLQRVAITFLNDSDYTLIEYYTNRIHGK